jgi:hypothetical protein
MKIHPQFLSKNGLPIFVILPYEEYQNILEKCEDIEDIEAIDAVVEVDLGDIT